MIEAQVRWCSGKNEVGAFATAFDLSEAELAALGLDLKMHQNGSKWLKDA